LGPDTEGERFSVFRRVVVVCGASLLLGLFLFGSRGCLNHLRIRKRIELLEGEINRIRDENRLLEREKEGLRSDPYYIEREARRLGMVRDGEWVVESSLRRDEDADL
jgi:cell division protein FtsB